jgi:hypothetical protein
VERGEEEIVSALGRMQTGNQARHRMKGAEGEPMFVMVAFAIVSTMVLGIGTGYLAILGILRLFGHRAEAAKAPAMTLRPATAEGSGD